MTEYTNQPQHQHDSNTIAEALNIYELIDSTGGILLGASARSYNAVITELLDELTRRKEAGRLLANPTGEANDRERLRIALTEGELYYRRRATMDARVISHTLRQTASIIEDLLDAAVIADEENNLLGREGLYSDELEAETEIMNLEREILDTRFNWIIGPMRPGETMEQAQREAQAIHGKGRRYFEF